MILIVVALVAAATFPALAASPRPSSAPGSAGSAGGPGQAENGKAAKAEVTLTGTVGSRTAADGTTEYTLTSGSTVSVLEAGPAWFYGDKHPLQPFVGKQVTIVGEQRTGSSEVEVRSVNGTTIRTAGPPPWAGGWKRVGKSHPGWSQEKWDRWLSRIGGKGAGPFGSGGGSAPGCWPPGHCKGGGSGAGARPPRPLVEPSAGS